MVLESAVISRMCLKNYNESDTLFCFSRLFITTIPLKMYQNNKYRIQVKLIPDKCIWLSSFSKLRITFTQGFRFQNIILQSSIPEVTNGLKNKETNIDVNTSLIINPVECQIFEHNLFLQYFKRVLNSIKKWPEFWKKKR